MNHISWHKMLIDKMDGNFECVRYFINKSTNRAFAHKSTTSYQKAVLRMHLKELKPGVKFELDR